MASVGIRTHLGTALLRIAVAAKSFSKNGGRAFSTTRAAPQLTNQQAREDLALSYRGMDYYGLGEGACNHLTMRAPAKNGKGDVMLLIPYGTHWSQVTASCLVGVDIQSREVVEGQGIGEDSAVCIHTSIYRALGEAVNCVMHAHPPYTTALSCLKDPRLKMIHQNSMRFFGKIAYDAEYEGTGDTGDESERLARNLKDKVLMIMGNHGVLSVGKSAAVAFDNLYYLERAAMSQMIAEATGRELAEATDNVAKDVADYYTKLGDTFINAHFQSIKKIFEGKEPNFRS